MNWIFVNGIKVVVILCGEIIIVNCEEIELYGKENCFIFY